MSSTVFGCRCVVSGHWADLRARALLSKKKELYREVESSFQALRIRFRRYFQLPRQPIAERPCAMALNNLRLSKSDVMMAIWLLCVPRTWRKGPQYEKTGGRLGRLSRWKNPYLSSGSRAEPCGHVGVPWWKS